MYMHMDMIIDLYVYTIILMSEFMYVRRVGDLVYHAYDYVILTWFTTGW